MNTYIALLRGINVSGQKKIKMADLRAHLAELEFTDIKTYIQSGNIIFKSTDSDIDMLQNQIRNKIVEKYGFEVPVLIKTIKELKDFISGFPFEFKEEESNRVFFTLLHDLPESDRLEKLEAFDSTPDLFKVQRNVVYLFCPGGYGKTKLSNNFFEQKLKVKATTRNLRTMHKLVNIALELSE